MTQNEKHALIAERLEGRTLRPQEWTKELWWHTPRGLIHENVPNYSTDLNLCHRVEERIAAMGRDTQMDYVLCLGSALASSSDRPFNRFVQLTAPATARVDAMVALIQEMEA